MRWNNEKSISSSKFVFIILTSQAQVEISPYAGYTFGGVTSYSYQGYRLRIDGVGNYGGGAAFGTEIIQLDITGGLVFKIGD